MRRNLRLRAAGPDLKYYRINGGIESNETKSGNQTSCKGQFHQVILAVRRRGSAGRSCGRHAEHAVGRHRDPDSRTVLLHRIQHVLTVRVQGRTEGSRQHLLRGVRKLRPQAGRLSLDGAVHLPVVAAVLRPRHHQVAVLRDDPLPSRRLQESSREGRPEGLHAHDEGPQVGAVRVPSELYRMASPLRPYARHPHHLPGQPVSEHRAGRLLRRAQEERA